DRFMPVQRSRAALHVLALVVFEGAAVALLHRVGGGPHVGIDLRDLDGWLAVSPPEQIVMSVLWLIALALGWWTLGSTLLYLAMRAVRFRAGVRVAERLALPLVRRVVDRAVAATLVTSALIGPAAPALAAERAPLLAATQVATTQYEPEPAGDGQDAPARPAGPQRTAPDPVDPPASLRERSSEHDGDRKRKGGDGGHGSGGGSGKMSEAEAEAAAREANAEAAAATAAEDAAGARAEAAAVEAARAEAAALDAARSEVARAADADADARDDGDAAGDPEDGDAGRDEDRKRERDARRAERAAERTSRRAPARAGPQPGSAYTVRTGDHLWNIAASVVGAQGAIADRRAVASYWAELVRSATPQLRSGDPNLIYPGETLELPPLQRPEG
ncbi:MAG TPA: hypothetical protein VK891_13305, partial [Euzebyales bacterium]|nr:hypothetical protein [Euzebyales bacterium]